jgi:hypothetical protein
MKLTKEYLKGLVKESLEEKSLEEAEGGEQTAQEEKIEVGQEEVKQTVNRFNEPKEYKIRKIKVTMPNGGFRHYRASTLVGKKNKEGEPLCKIWLESTETPDGKVNTFETQVGGLVPFTESSIWSGVKGDLIRMGPPPKRPPEGSSWSTRAVYRDQMKTWTGTEEGLNENKDMKLTKHYIKDLVKETLNESKKTVASENKISKSTLDRIIKEEYTKLVNEGGDFDPSAKRSKTVYTARGTSVSLGWALDKGLAYRFEKGGKLIYPEKYQKKHWGYTISDKPSEPEKPDHPTVAMAKKFVASYDRADRLDNLPGDLFHTRPDRLEILGRARKAAAGDETVNLTQQELDNFYK